MAEFDASAAIWSSGDNPSVCHRQPPAEAEVMTRSELDYCGVPVPDGGGICSTADWFQPRVKDDLFRDLRRRFESLAMEWRLVPRLMAHVSNPRMLSCFLLKKCYTCVKRLLVFCVTMVFLATVMSNPISLFCFPFGKLWPR